MCRTNITYNHRPTASPCISSINVFSTTTTTTNHFNAAIVTTTITIIIATTTTAASSTSTSTINISPATITNTNIYPTSPSQNPRVESYPPTATATTVI